ncbi:hypothetical protein TREMEDRAFT_58039 [Tremella mesenterica DSM 1558]|uniref:uncharacterized protein n=1 Tax=Tremella mesenterica (strain ATCC 24925 / CBS 8224 / DSM 1558 / NBRC 9311 / NRRL Y-6157 / RJB 2259-6 / UBC 559-6) TaxID=578456 RepID=UPI0003F498EF|nr:uncharacterized protein TREMEDRAFT_58039 [Tremella mesenterica DSM 1558]EIW71905.1 hypothetical protein TREMEDRAFT_58039 [Tremella mesenterica DSM 1558]
MSSITFDRLLLEPKETSRYLFDPNKLTILRLPDDSIFRLAYPHLGPNILISLEPDGSSNWDPLLLEGSTTAPCSGRNIRSFCNYHAISCSILLGLAAVNMDVASAPTVCGTMPEHEFKEIFLEKLIKQGRTYAQCVMTQWMFVDQTRIDVNWSADQIRAARSKPVIQVVELTKDMILKAKSMQASERGPILSWLDMVGTIMCQYSRSSKIPSVLGDFIKKNSPLSSLVSKPDFDTKSIQDWDGSLAGTILEEMTSKHSANSTLFGTHFPPGPTRPSKGNIGRSTTQSATPTDPPVDAGMETGETVVKKGVTRTPTLAESKGEKKEKKKKKKKSEGGGPPSAPTDGDQRSETGNARESVLTPSTRPASPSLPVESTKDSVMQSQRVDEGDISQEFSHTPHGGGRTAVTPSITTREPGKKKKGKKKINYDGSKVIEQREPANIPPTTIAPAIGIVSLAEEPDNSQANEAQDSGRISSPQADHAVSNDHHPNSTESTQLQGTSTAGNGPVHGPDVQHPGKRSKARRARGHNNPRPPDAYHQDEGGSHTHVETRKAEPDGLRTSITGHGMPDVSNKDVIFPHTSGSNDADVDRTVVTPVQEIARGSSFAPNQSFHIEKPHLSEPNQANFPTSDTDRLRADLSTEVNADPDLMGQLEISRQVRQTLDVSSEKSVDELPDRPISLEGSSPMLPTAIQDSESSSSSEHCELPGPSNMNHPNSSVTMQVLNDTGKHQPHWPSLDTSPETRHNDWSTEMHRVESHNEDGDPMGQAPEQEVLTVERDAPIPAAQFEGPPPPLTWDTVYARIARERGSPDSHTVTRDAQSDTGSTGFTTEIDQGGYINHPPYRSTGTQPETFTSGAARFKTPPLDTAGETCTSRGV